MAWLWKNMDSCGIEDAQFRSPKPMILEKEGLPFQILVEWMHLPPFLLFGVFFNPFSHSYFCFCVGRTKRGPCLKGFDMDSDPAFGLVVLWLFVEIVGFSSFAPILCLENPLHFSFQPRSSIASTSSSRNIHYSLSSFLGVEMMPLLRYTLVLWPLSTLTPFSWEKKVMRFYRAPKKGKKKTIHIVLKLFEPRHWDTKGPKWPHCFAIWRPLTTAQIKTADGRWHQRRFRTSVSNPKHPEHVDQKQQPFFSRPQNQAIFSCVCLFGWNHNMPNLCWHFFRLLGCPWKLATS